MPPLPRHLPPTLLSTQQCPQRGVSGQDLEQQTGDLGGLITPPWSEEQGPESHSRVQFLMSSMHLPLSLISSIHLNCLFCKSVKLEAIS